MHHRWRVTIDLDFSFIFFWLSMFAPTGTFTLFYLSLAFFITEITMDGIYQEVGPWPTECFQVPHLIGDGGSRTSDFHVQTSLSCAFGHPAQNKSHQSMWTLFILWFTERNLWFSSSNQSHPLLPETGLNKTYSSAGIQIAPISCLLFNCVRNSWKYISSLL